ncbi:MAG: hybrid sensor histidine kinase/response regulator [Armatimonadetes bacterium]|jgi:signal transduction histidine kinase|nr:hybrid sensor histidine kinase/response regulator [Armatimonadota bacterium]
MSFAGPPALGHPVVEKDSQPDCRGTILHVDDNETNRYAVARVLTAAGYAVVEAETGEAGLRMLARHPDLLILDVRLPDLQGFEISRRIRADPDTASLPILHLSALAVDVADRVEGLRSGADAYLSSSVDPQELLATVDALLRGRRAELELARVRDELRVQLAESQRLHAATRQAMAEAEVARTELAALYAYKDQFLVELAHELRTPLATLSNCMQVIALTVPESAGVQRSRDTMERQIGQITRLVTDLMDIARIRRGAVALEAGQVDLAAVLQHVHDDLFGLAQARQLLLSVALPEAPLYVRGDHARLIQIFTNLVQNALKYTDAGGRIWLDAREDGGSVTASVRDTGTGISSELLPFLFDLFMQVDGTRDRSHGGLGIGLALVKSLVELHGGTIEAHSEGLGTGSQFVVRLPRA